MNLGEEPMDHDGYDDDIPTRPEPPPLSVEDVFTWDASQPGEADTPGIFGPESSITQGNKQVRFQLKHVSKQLQMKDKKSDLGRRLLLFQGVHGHIKEITYKLQIRNIKTVH